MTKIYIPRDMAALAMGAKRVLAAVQKEIAARGLDVEIIRTGSRGMLWLEPLVEVETPAGRIGYGLSSPPTWPRCSTRDSSRAARMRWPSARPRRIPISPASPA